MSHRPIGSEVFQKTPRENLAILQITNIFLLQTKMLEKIFNWVALGSREWGNEAVPMGMGWGWNFPHSLLFGPASQMSNFGVVNFEKPTLVRTGCSSARRMHGWMRNNIQQMSYLRLMASSMATGSPIVSSVQDQPAFFFSHCPGCLMPWFTF